MKRVIKFKRVFQHSETGRICMTSWGNVTHKDEDCTDWSSFKSPSQISGYYPVADIQFTGLKDKNGKEIYEGDILKTETDKPMVVTWSKKFASFCISREGWAFQHWFGEACDPENCEVIGNIYENPELIK
jgi:hypothetical protein